MCLAKCAMKLYVKNVTIHEGADRVRGRGEMRGREEGEVYILVLLPPFQPVQPSSYRN